MKDENKRCCFCGQEFYAPSMIKSPTSPVYICRYCAQTLNFKITNNICDNNQPKDLAASTIDSIEADISQKENKASPNDALSSLYHMTPPMIKSMLDDYIIGQENAKKAISVAMYNHYKRIHDDSNTLRKSNVFMVGPSGSGKTHIVTTMAKILDFPLAICSATSFTEAGYVGENVESCLAQLLEICGGDFRKAQQGIIFIDEIDKIAAKESAHSRDVSGAGVQSGLLKLVEGSTVTVPINRNGSTVKFDTTDVLFIVGGAFCDTFNEYAEATSNPIGFQNSVHVREPKKLTPDALIEYGMMREFVGRFPSMVLLDDLDEDDLVRILIEPKDSLTKEYTALFQKDGIQLTFDYGYLLEIAHLAKEKHIGARGLRSLIEESLMDIMFEVPDMGNVEKCIITEDTITTHKADLVLREPAFAFQ